MSRNMLSATFAAVSRVETEDYYMHNGPAETAIGVANAYLFPSRIRGGMFCREQARSITA